MQDFRVKSGLRVSGNVYGVDYLTANNINVTYNGIFGNLTVNGSLVGNVTGTVSSLSNQTTSNLAEGTNQYFTNARAYANLTAASINALADVDTVTTPPSAGYGLLWNGTAWVPTAITASFAEFSNVANISAVATFSNNANIANVALTSNIANIALRAVVASQADNANTAAFATFATNSNTSNSAGFATLAYTALAANFAEAANTANTALRANVATQADNANTALTANVANTVLSLSNFTTANVNEGSNLYYTNARVEAAIQPTVAELRALVSRFNSNVLYVAQNGNDANDGTTMGNAFANIHVALAAATQWTTVFLKSGDYRLYNQPVTIPRRVALVGDNLRTTTIRPTQPSVDMFYVENASYVTGITFRDHVSPAAAFSYNPNGSAGTIVTSPYIQNCSSITTTGTGMRVDGRYVTGLRSMVCDAYTQTNEGGIGIHMLNRGYTQLVSVFTICCSIAIKCENGGFCSITNSNAAFGTYGLWADGVSEPLYFGKVANATVEATNSVVIYNLPIKPNYGDAAIFANYNQTKCARDTRLIVDSLAIDLGYNSNTQSTFAGLQYWSQPTSAIPNQGVETIAAINYAKSLATNIVANIRITSPYQVANVQQFATSPTLIADPASNVKIATEFDLITSIISNGTVGVSDLIVPNGYPANTNAFVNHASNLLYLNNVFIASEVVTFVNTTYPEFVYNANTCFRDVGFILDSIRFDLLHGGNRQAVQAGTYYYQYDATDTQINDQVVQTGAAYYFIGNLVDKIVRGNVIANVYQTAITQNTTAASYATSAEANLLLADVALIANIVTLGPNVAPAKTSITFTPSSNTNIINATKLVLANREFITAEVIGFVNQNWANISNGAGTFYTVSGATELISNTSTVTFLEVVNESLLANSTVSFHQGSYISSSGHTFEYVGSGTTIATALPYLGGVPIQENEVTELRGGKVYFTSTDQLGDFRIGTGLVINRVDGTITGRTFNKALFAVMTPYILAIEG